MHEKSLFVTLKITGVHLVCVMDRIRYLLIARLLRLTRLLVLMERYQVMVTTFLKLIPSLMPAGAPTIWGQDVTEVSPAARNRGGAAVKSGGDEATAAAAQTRAQGAQAD